MKSFSLFLLRMALWLPICCLGTQWPIPPATISTPGVDASNPSIAVDPHGNFVAVWLENGFVISRSDVVKGVWTSPAVRFQVLWPLLHNWSSIQMGMQRPSG